MSRFLYIAFGGALWVLAAVTLAWVPVAHANAASSLTIAGFCIFFGALAIAIGTSPDVPVAEGPKT